MKSIFSISLLLLLFMKVSVAQKIPEYTASNGILYLEGDTITLGVGSSCGGAFNFVYSGVATTILMSLSEMEDYDPRLPAGSEGIKVVIRKIKISGEKTILTFVDDELGGYVIDIEAAIKSCEVAFCQPNDFLSQQQFEKLILLNQACWNQEISVEKFDELRGEMIGVGFEKN